MSEDQNKKNTNHIDHLRDRLYSRGQKSEQKRDAVPAESAKPKKQPVPRSWSSSDSVRSQRSAFTPGTEAKQSPAKKTAPANPVADRPRTSAAEPAKPNPEKTAASLASVATMREDDDMPKRAKHRSYRKKILLGGLALFVFTIFIASVNLFLGGDNISGENINISIEGPFAVGGGEVLPLQVVVSNDNSVPIQAATLIIQYPAGTQSVEDAGKELFIQRLPLETINPGEVVSVPLRAVVYGDEDEEKTISIEMEYRIKGSNSTFAKQVEPYRFKITTSPVVLSVESLSAVSSGEETDLTISVRSNSTNELKNVLVTAEYPFGFDFRRSDPEPVSGRNVWRIESLPPEGSAEIVLTGTFTGENASEQVLHFNVGIPSEDDPYELMSVFSSAQTDVTLEKPFFDVRVIPEGAGGQNNDVIMPGSNTRVRVEAKNTLTTSIYDAVIKASLSGNALADTRVQAGRGFYDSATKTLTWDVSSVPDLREIEPGETVTLTFTLQPSQLTERTPQIAINTNVRARRVFDDNATEQSLGDEETVIKVASVMRLLSETGRDTGAFADHGPIPPVAEEETTYTLSFMITNSTNDLSDAAVSAVLPTYVSWLDATSGDGSLSYNATSREVSWDAGDLDANQSKIASFQVSFLPSVSQIGTTPTLLGEQTVSATDRFTGVTLQDTRDRLTTQLPSEAGYDRDSGVVTE